MEVSPELRWILLRAFGPVDAPADGLGAAGGVRARQALALADQWALGPRIATRIPSARLLAELGTTATKELVFSRLRAIAVERRLRRMAGAVALLGAELGLPLVFLKHMALHLSGLATEGVRRPSDVDVLVPRGRVKELYAVLRRNGFSTLGLPDTDHHLGVLVHDSQDPLEVHGCVPGLRARRGQSFLDADTLLGTEAVVRVDGWPESTWVPHRDLLLAHTIVHGLAQHGPAPRHLCRTLGDVTDLAFHRGPLELASACYRWVADDLSEAELLAVIRLARALARGVPPNAMDPRGHERLLLDHIVASTLDSRYAQALKLQALGPGLHDASRWRATLHRAFRAVFVNRAQLVRIYGGSRTELGWLGLRLFRPFDLALRTARAAGGWWALRHGAAVPRGPHAERANMP